MAKPIRRASPIDFDRLTKRKSEIFEAGARSICSIAYRSDGWIFFLVLDHRGKFMVRAGYQYRTIGEYRRHARQVYPSRGRNRHRYFAETMAILDLFERAVKNAILH